MKRILAKMTAAALTLLLFPCGAHALSVQEYRELLSSSQPFAAADNAMQQAWQTLQGLVPDAARATAEAKHSAWLASGRDEEAKKLMEYGVPKDSAYATVTSRKARELADVCESFGGAAPAAAPGQPAALPGGVTAEGQGSTQMEALNNAMSSAVMQEAGVYMRGRTDIDNDDLSEKISAHSRGMVSKYLILSQSQGAGGLWTVKIRAMVDKEQMKDLAASVKTKKVEMSEFAMALQAQQAAQSKAEMFKSFELPFNMADFLIYESHPLEENGQLYMLHSLKVDVNKYSSVFVPEVEKFLKKMARRRKQMFFRENAQLQNEMLAQGLKIDIFTAARDGTALEESNFLRVGDSNLKNSMQISGANGPFICIMTDNARFTAYDAGEQGEQFRDSPFASTKYALRFYTDLELMNGETKNVATNGAKRYIFAFPGQSGAPVVIAPVIGYGDQESQHIVYKQPLRLPAEMAKQIRNGTGGFTVEKIEPER